MAERIRITDAELRGFLRDRRYWHPAHPERAAYVGWVTDGYRALHGTEEGRKAGAVWVKPYTRARDGKMENVAGHWRSPRPGQAGGGGAPGDPGDGDTIIPVSRRGDRSGGTPPAGGGGGTAPRTPPKSDVLRPEGTGSPPRPGARTPEDLTARSKPENRTSRGTRIQRVEEGPAQLAADFEGLTAGRPVRTESDRLGPVHIGSTADGRRVVARNSRDGRPTIEVQRADGTRTSHEFRYGGQ